MASCWLASQLAIAASDMAQLPWHVANQNV
jgi:hypothetical protein